MSEEQSKKEVEAEIVSESEGSEREQDKRSSAETRKESAADIEKNKGMAILAYFIFFLPLLTEAKNSPFVKFHVNQGLNLFLFYLALNVLGMIIPFFGQVFILPLGFVAAIALLIIGIANAAAGQTKELPLIGQFRFIKL